MDNKKVGIGIASLIVILIGVALFFMLNKETTYEVTFKNETISEVVVVKENETVSKPIDPIKEGYTFEGWYYNGMEFDFTKKITENITLEARWIKDSAQKWVVTFNTNGGNEIDSLNVEDGKVIVDIPTPTREGYEFEGWYYNNERFDFNTVITQNITLTAKWKEIEKPVYNDNVTVKTRYTVTFDSQGGTSVNGQRVEKNKMVIKPKDPIKEGYKFIGWYYNGSEYNFNKKVTKNIVLTAKWEKIEEIKEPTTPEKPADPETPEQPEEVKIYTVVFNQNNEATMITSQKVEEGKLVIKPSDPTRLGYKFIGWYLNDEKFDFNTKVTQDITLIAKWEKLHIITYEIEETDSYVGQVILYVLKDGQKVDGIVDITTASGKVITDFEISKDGYITNGDLIKVISNVRAK